MVLAAEGLLVADLVLTDETARTAFVVLPPVAFLDAFFLPPTATETVRAVEAKGLVPAFAFLTSAVFTPEVFELELGESLRFEATFLTLLVLLTRETLFSEEVGTF